MKTADAARGKWRGILLALGVPKSALSGKHGPCPMCGGKDRFRFDNKDGAGTFFCSQCKPGNGFDLLQRLKGWDFRTAAAEVDRVVGNVKAEPVKPSLSPERRRDMLNRLWLSGERVRPGDPVHSYLDRRGLPMPQNIDSIRYVQNCPVPEESGGRWAMVAMVSGPDGKPVTLHRTFLGPNGKADIAEPRALMPGDVPPGSAVRLSMHGETLGIAEGIETALKAGERFGVPVWAVINSVMLAKWIAPEGVRRVLIFGDNDPEFGGQAATFALAHRLAVKGIEVEPHIPVTTGLDWADRDAA